MSDIDITTSSIDALLSNLNAHKAASPDGISARVLKEMHSSIALILKVIFDFSLNTGIVPNEQLWYSYIDVQTDLISMDFAKPFDTVPHQG